MTISEFKKKYGEIGWRLLIEEFIARAPEFKGDVELAACIGSMMADLESVLESTNIPWSYKDQR